MSTSSVFVSHGVLESHALSLEALALACGISADFVRQLVDEGLVDPAVRHPEWRFGGEEISRVRRICRLQRDFEANLTSVAVMLDLLDEIARLNALLNRLGHRIA